MKRVKFIVAFFVLLVLIAVFSEKFQNRGDGCDFDGNGINSINEVVITTADGSEHHFCSLCCSASWLDNKPDVKRSIVDGKGGSITVVDEVSGEKIDATLAYWVQSALFSVRENDCQLHVFKDPSEAAKHIQSHQGSEKKGYLAGLGQELPWAPNFVTGNLDGIMIDLLRFRGKVVFIRFWNSSNPFTEKDLAFLTESYHRWHKQGFMVLAINVQQRETTVKAFTAGMDLPFPVLLDLKGQIADLYKVRGYPTGFLVDKSGVIRNQSIGEILPEMMEPLIFPLL